MIESRPGGFPGFRHLRVAARSSGLKGQEILFSLGVRNSHRSDSSLLINLVDSQLPVLCAPFFMSCVAMEFAETGHRREERSRLPASSLMMLHALRLECNKLMELTASSHRSCYLWLIRESIDKAAVSESVPAGARRKERWRVLHFLS